MVFRACCIFSTKLHENILNDVPSALRIADQPSGIADQRRLELFENSVQPRGILAVFLVVHGNACLDNRDFLQEQRFCTEFLR